MIAYTNYFEKFFLCAAFPILIFKNLNIKKVLVLYDYFDPAYKAGGPIRSLVNLVKILDNEMDLFVLSTNQDHDGTTLDVVPDIWLSYDDTAHVMYLSKGNKSYSSIKSCITNLLPDVVYLNGIYSLSFVVYPFFVLKGLQNTRTIIAPRGMLQTQSLSIKPLKKKIYLRVLFQFLIQRKIEWHATTTQEEYDLKKFVGNNALIHVLGNVPSFTNKQKLDIDPSKKPTVLGTVALISPMKNVHLILSAFNTIREEIEYQLYGPVKDEPYWKQCQEIIATLPSNICIRHFGEIQPDQVSEKIAAMDFYIQPSKSENFGHSIFEAFNQGIPVIISDQTPWKGLKDKKAGWDIDLNDPTALKQAVKEALNMNNASYREFREGARKVAEDYMNNHDFVSLYKELFS